MTKMYQDKYWLFDQYMFLGNTSYCIASKCGCDNKTIWRWLKRHSITIRPRGYKLLRHGHKRAGISSPTHVSWRGMKQRCQNPRSANYSRYGQLGTRICDRWNCFENFLIDMGERPKGMTLDRVDTYGDYEPDNCRWATAKEQRANRRKP